MKLLGRMGLQPGTNTGPVLTLLTIEPLPTSLIAHTMYANASVARNFAMLSTYVSQVFCQTTTGSDSSAKHVSLFPPHCLYWKYDFIFFTVKFSTS